jgi:hypothetical protein
MFGKIINGKLVKAPCRIKYKGRIYHNPGDTIYSKSGYFKIKYQDKPDDGYEYIDYYEQIDNFIIQSWQQKPEKSDDINLDIPDEINSEIGSIPSMPNNQLTLLLQRISELEAKVELLIDTRSFKDS